MKRIKMFLGLGLVSLLLAGCGCSQNHKHVWGNPIYELINQNQMRAKRTCTSNSSHFEEEISIGSYEIIKTPTKETDGLGKYTFSFENSAFETQITEVVIHKLIYGQVPTLSGDGKTLFYGLYPQKCINDSVIISALESLKTCESNGYYFYNDAFYTKFEATPFKNNYEFDNGDVIVRGKTYWFECELIEWNVLNNSGNNYLVVSKYLLDVHSFYSYKESSWGVSDREREIDGEIVFANNYEYSDIRNWLISDFYNSAFSLENSHIQTTDVDNTYDNSNPYACNDTRDKVFLLSKRDYLNSSYGFSSSEEQSESRVCRTTDWLRARGGFYETAETNKFNSSYWTRSPDRDFSYYAIEVGSTGRFGRNGNKTNQWSGVRPAITIEI